MQELRVKERTNGSFHQAFQVRLRVHARFQQLIHPRFVEFSKRLQVFGRFMRVIEVTYGIVNMQCR